MERGYIIGYEINEQTCQLSFYNDQYSEPQTVGEEKDHFQIPVVIGKVKNAWVYGKEAARLVNAPENFVIGGLLRKSLAGEAVFIGEQRYEMRELLLAFVRHSLEPFPKIDALVFTVPVLSRELAGLLRWLGEQMGIPQETIFIQDYKESFCYYLFYQPKELWQYETALFFCEKNEIKVSMLKKMQMGKEGGNDTYVTVEDVESAHIEELTAVYPIVNESKARTADLLFCKFVQGIFARRNVSAVFLTGEAFENNWYPNALRALCNGRRAFVGVDLYSRGACYSGYRKRYTKLETPVYFAEGRLTERITLQLRVSGKMVQYPFVPWGAYWYECNHSLDILVKQPEDIVLQIESMFGDGVRTEVLSLAAFPKREDYTLRLELQSFFEDEHHCTITVRDKGFGDFFAATDAYIQTTIELGGNHGDVASLSPDTGDASL